MWHLPFAIWLLAFGIGYIWILEIRHLAFDIWHLRFGIWHFTFDLRQLAFDIWHLTCGICHLQYGIWHWILKIRPLAWDIWHLTLDIFYIAVIFQPFPRGRPSPAHLTSGALRKLLQRFGEESQRLCYERFLHDPKWLVDANHPEGPLGMWSQWWHSAAMIRWPPNFFSGVVMKAQRLERLPKYMEWFLMIFHGSGSTTTQQLQLLQATGWQRLYYTIFVFDSCVALISSTLVD